MSSTDPAARTLVLVRHAKAEDTAASDAERRLTDRGAGDAADAGRWLAARGVTPDHALVSAAARTTATWQAMAAAAGWRLEADVDRGLYSAGPETVIDLLRAVPTDARTAVVVGHNPTIASLAQLLDDGEGDPEAGNQLALGYPPASVTVLQLGVAWADLAPAAASVVAFRPGRA
ncbi:SixA phosphatase family protein [Nocardioides sp. SYSU DS0663]|uniref:SixA phosphatase family protein n=1 Tax=Nocardioides sp. SYSU DS0663 TaxID=3416445 RepID=UPI003F4C05F5